MTSSTSPLKVRDHMRIKVINTTVFGCMKKKEAYNVDMPFRFCPSCGIEINETEKQIRRVLVRK